MQSLTETLDTVLPLFADVVVRPRFGPEQVALEKAQQAGAIARRNDDPAGIARRAFAQAIYGPDSPYARTPEVWTVDAVTPRGAAAWHARYVVPQNTLLAVWGDFDADDMIQRLEDAFSGWQTPDGLHGARAADARDDDWPTRRSSWTGRMSTRARSCSGRRAWCSATTRTFPRSS